MNLSAIFKNMQVAEPKLQQLKKATDGIESLFVKDLLNVMQKSVNKVHFGDQAGSDMYQELMNQAIAEQVGRKGTLGIGKLLYNQMSPKVLAQVAAHERISAAREKKD